MANPLPQNVGTSAPTLTPQLAADIKSYVPSFQPSVPQGISIQPPVQPTAQTTPQPTSQPPTQQPIAPSGAQVDTSGLDPDVVNVVKAWRQTESNGNFQAQGASGEYGAYQFEPATWNGVVQKYLGTNTPLDQATPAQQTAVAYGYARDLKAQGLNVGQIASTINSGNPDPSATGTGVNKQGVPYDVPGYVQKFFTNYQQFKSTPSDTSSVPDTSSAQSSLPTYGATFASSPNDNGLVAGLKAFGNLPSSAYNLGAGLVSSVLHPVQTVEGIGKGIIGGAENLTGENPGNPDDSQQVANQIGKAFMDRYGSLEALQNTATNDPVGFGADVASIIGGGAGLIGKGAEASELASRVASPVTEAVSRATGPLKDLLGSSDTEVTSAASRVGANLPAGATTNSPVVRGLEALSQTGAGGGQYAGIVDKAVSTISDFADKLVTSAGGAEDIAKSGEIVAKGVQDYEDTFKNAYETAWKPIAKEIGSEAPVSTQASVDALKSVIADYQSRGLSVEAKYFQTKLKAVTNAPTVSLLKKIRQDVASDTNFKLMQTKGVSPSQVDMLKVRSAIEGDIQKSIGSLGGNQMLAQYKKINAAYSKGMSDISNGVVKSIRNMATNENYSKIVSGIAKPSIAAEDIPRIYSIIGDQATKEVQSGLMRSILQGAKNAEGDFTPQGILREMKAYQKGGVDKLQAMLTPEQIQGLKDIGTLNKALGDAQKISKGSQEAFLLKAMTEISTVGHGAYDLVTGNILGAAQSIAGIIGVEGASYFIASPMGQKLLKMFLTRGSEFTSEGAKVGLTPTPQNGTVPGNDVPGTVVPRTSDSVPTIGWVDSGTNTPSAIQSVKGQPSGTSSVNTNANIGSLSPQLEEKASKIGFNTKAALAAGYSVAELDKFLNEQ